jgi:hypothetical protein
MNEHHLVGLGLLLLTIVASILYSVLRVTKEQVNQVVMLQQEVIKDVTFNLFASVLAALLWPAGIVDRLVSDYSQLLLFMGTFCLVYWAPFFGFRWLNDRTRR